MKYHENISTTVGNTPIVKLNKTNKGLNANVFVKLEFYNPTSSVKDRIAVGMINNAEEAGKLKEGGIIVEPTSGNTGLGLAMVAASRGYKLIITMPETMSMERQMLMKHLGAEIILTDGSKGMTGAIQKAEEIVANTPNSFMPQQFKNKANPEFHYKTTGPEIWEAMNGKVDIFVSGIGTGGTFTGTGKFLKEKNPKVELVAIEPTTSAVLSGQAPGKHGIQGIGAGFIPEILDKNIIAEVIKVEDSSALSTARQLAKEEGILCGISSGAAVFAALNLSSRPENKGKNIVVILPDTGERYISTDLFIKH